MALILLLAQLAAGAPALEPAILSDRSVAVGGTTLRLRCGGTRPRGAPLVVLEAGAFNSVDTWRDVQAPMAAFARVCAYDRPGRGESGPAPAGLDADGAVRLLRDLLRASDEPPPYVMVGHSLGGLMAQLYLMRYPSDVHGLVLVDSSHPDQIARMAALPAPPPRPLPPGVAAEPVTVTAFAEAMAGDRWRVEGPLVVLTRGRWTNGTDSTDDLARLQIWRELQDDLATRSPRARHETASGSGHYIQNDEPERVIDAVRAIVTAR